MRSFLLELDREGSVMSLSFGDGSHGWRARVIAAGQSGAPHLFYDPLDGGTEYIWLSWQGIEQHVMEQLIGQRFERVDFLPTPAFARRERALDPAGQFPRRGVSCSNTRAA